MARPVGLVFIEARRGDLNNKDVPTRVNAIFFSKCVKFGTSSRITCFLWTSMSLSIMSGTEVRMECTETHPMHAYTEQS